MTYSHDIKFCLINIEGVLQASDFHFKKKQYNIEGKSMEKEKRKIWIMYSQKSEFWMNSLKKSKRDAGDNIKTVFASCPCCRVVDVKGTFILLNSLPKFHLNSIAWQSYLSLFMQCCRCFHPSHLWEFLLGILIAGSHPEGPPTRKYIPQKPLYQFL